MTEKNAAEVKKEHIDRMGAALGAQYNALWQEVAYIHEKWAQYVELFGTKPGRVGLLNDTAPLFFRIVQDVLWEDTLLHLARLTDPRNSMGSKKKENLTIQNLPVLVNDSGLSSKVLAAVEEAAKKTDFCRDWRNRHIAHRDLDLAIAGTPLKPLSPASRVQVTEAMIAIVNVLNIISGAYLNSETHFDVRVSPNGAEHLLYLLFDALELKQQRKADLRSGAWKRPIYPDEIF